MLLSKGVVLVTTSNRHPRDLYRNGIQRESFIPALEVRPQNPVLLFFFPCFRLSPSPISTLSHNLLLKYAEADL